MRVRVLANCVFALSLFASLAYAGQEEEVLGKKRSEWLTILKSHPQIKFRRAAVIALEVIGPRSAGVLDGLYQAIESDAEAEVRRDVALTLGRMGVEAKGAANVLGQALKRDKADTVREAAALVLAGKLNDQAETQVMALAGALKDSHAGTRAAAAEALKNLGEKAKIALPQLTALAQDRHADRFARLYAIQMISRWGDENVLQTLIGIYEDKSVPPAIRQGVIEGIGRMGHKAETANTILVGALKDKEVEVRRAAALALSQVGPHVRRVWPPVKDAYADSDSGVRNQIIRVAGIVGKEEKQAVALLVGAAEKDATLENRLAALQELGNLEEAAVDALSALQRLAGEDPRSSVREAAQAALKKIKSQ